MPQRPYLHSVAKVVLKGLRNKIYINGRDAFSDIPPEAEELYHTTPLNTQIEYGKRLKDNEELADTIYITFSELKQKYGLSVYSIDVSEESKGWAEYQREIYLILPRRKDFPRELSDNKVRTKELRFEMDLINMQVRGIGKSFGTIKGRYGMGDITPWMPVQNRVRPNNLKEYMQPKYDDYQDYSDTLLDSLEGKTVVDTCKKIPELATMILNDGKSILAIPKDPDKVQKIVNVGKTGGGKTFSTVAIMSKIPYKFGDEVGILNDAFDQFYDSMLPQDNLSFTYTLERLGEEPKHLPIISLYLSGPNVTVRYNDESAGFRYVVDIKNFCLNYMDWSKGVGNWELGKAIKYMSKEVADKIKECKTSKQVRNILYETIEDASEDKGKQQMIYKWESAFENIFRDQFTSNLFTYEQKTAHEWEAEIQYSDGPYMIRGDPFLVAMYAGLIPVVNVTMIKTKPIYSKKVVELLKKTLEWQDIMKSKSKMKRIWLVWDEMKDLLKPENKDVFAAFEEFFTQARFRLVGCVGNIQQYCKLSSSVRQSLDYLIVFDVQTKEEKKAIGDDFDIAEELEAIGELKKFECLFVAREKVVIYDIDGRREEHDRGVWKGTILPPLCRTKKPSEGVST
jgi:hypothetical protein